MADPSAGQPPTRPVLERSDTVHTSYGEMEDRPMYVNLSASKGDSADQWPPEPYNGAPSEFMPPFGMPYPGMYSAGSVPGMPMMSSWMYPGCMPGIMPGPAPFHMMQGMPPDMFAGAGNMLPRGHGQARPQEVKAGPLAAAKTKKSRPRKSNKAKGKDEEDDGSPQAEADDANAARSPELVEVRKQGAKCKLTLKKVLPSIQEFALDQHGSRWVQTKLDEASDEEKHEVFRAIKQDAGKLAGDVFANHVVQKLFEIGTSDQKSELINELKDDIMRLCKETHGCRVVQKAIAVCPKAQQMVITQELAKDVQGLIENPHGNHVIQKSIESMNVDSLQFIISKIEKETEKVAMHMYGCRIIQRMLEHFAESQLCGMLDRILGAIPQLTQDSYGNYVIQHILEHGRLEDKKKIIMEVAAKVTEFSKAKHASNVVEKCFETATQGVHQPQLLKEREALFSSVLGKPGQFCPLYDIMEDKFGNYIVQRMIEHGARGPEREELKECLSNVLDQLAKGSTGPSKHIYSAYMKAFEEK